MNFIDAVTMRENRIKTFFVIMTLLFLFRTNDLGGRDFSVDEVGGVPGMIEIRNRFPYKLLKNGEPVDMDSREGEILFHDLHYIAEERNPSWWTWHFVKPDMGVDEMLRRFEVWEAGVPAYSWRVNNKKSDRLLGAWPGYESGSESGKSTGFSGFSTNSVGVVEAKFEHFINMGLSTDFNLIEDLQEDGPDEKWLVISQDGDYSPDFIRDFAVSPNYTVFEDRHGAKAMPYISYFPATRYSMYYYEYDGSMFKELPDTNKPFYGIGTGYKMPVSTDPGKILDGFRFDCDSALAFFSRSVRSRRDVWNGVVEFDEVESPGYSVMIAMNIEKLQPAIPYLDKAFYVQDLGDGKDPVLSKQKNTKYYWDNAPWGNDTDKIWRNPFNYVPGGIVTDPARKNFINTAIIAGDLMQNETDVYPLFIWRHEGLSMRRTELIENFFILPDNSRIFSPDHYIVLGGGGTYSKGDGNLITFIINPETITPQDLIENPNGGGFSLIRLY